MIFNICWKQIPSLCFNTAFKMSRGNVEMYILDFIWNLLTVF